MGREHSIYRLSLGQMVSAESRKKQPSLGHGHAPAAVIADAS